MPPTSLLDQITQGAREEPILRDPRWEAYARAELDPAETADLLASARAAGIDEETITALGPPDTALRERMIEVALKKLGTPKDADRAETDPQETAPPDTATSPAPTSRRRTVVAAWRRWWPAAAGAVALAAAIAWLVLRPPQSPLPEYTLQIEGGAQDTLNTPSNAPVPKFVPGVRITITLRPEKSVSGRIAAVAFLHDAHGTRAWNVPVEVADGGAVRIAGPADTLFRDVPPGAWDVWIAVGDPSALPDAERLTSTSGSRGDGFVILRQLIVWIDREGHPAP